MVPVRVNYTIISYRANFPRTDETQIHALKPLHYQFLVHRLHGETVFSAIQDSSIGIFLLSPFSLMRNNT